MEMIPAFSNLREMIETQASRVGDKIYLLFYDDEFTFNRLNSEVNRFANGLREFGVGKGDIVHVYMNNSPNALIANLAANKLGAIAGPINCWWQAPEIEYLLNDSMGKILVTEPCYAQVIKEIGRGCPHLKTIVEDSDSPSEGNIPFSTLMKGPADLPFVEINSDDDAYLFYTSGTTGKPKGTLLTHGGILHCIEGIRQALEGPEVTGDERALIFLPMFHVNGMMSMISVIYRGISVVLRMGFSAGEFGEVVQRYKPNFFSGVPAVYNILLQLHDELKSCDMSSLKYGICGAAPMPVELFRKFEQTFGIQIIEGYGLTEGTVASTMNPRMGVKKIGSIGKALPGQEVRLVDDDAKELPAGKVGEIVIRGRNLMRGYLRKPEETAEALRDGWLFTGDMGYMDEDGYFFIVERKKDMIIRGGENIYPKEVEDILFEHPAVLEAAVIGVPDKVMGEEVKAVVVLKSGEKVEPADLIGFCKARLAYYKVPKEVEFVESLPKNVIGKVLKKELRERELSIRGKT